MVSADMSLPNKSSCAFDLAMVSKYNYYTGVIFSAYTYQAGSAIAKGGRYDNLLEKFGKNAPATGFVVMIDELVTVLTRQKRCPVSATKNILVLYSDMFCEALKKAKVYREQGYATVLMKKEYSEEQYKKFAADNNFSEVVYLDGSAGKEGN